MLAIVSSFVILDSRKRLDFFEVDFITVVVGVKLLSKFTNYCSAKYVFKLLFDRLLSKICVATKLFKFLFLLIIIYLLLFTCIQRRWARPDLPVL